MWGVTRQLLLVEDDSRVRRVLRMALEDEGFHVTEAADGSQCLSAMREHSPDVVLLDVMLPDRDGFSVCREIRKDSDVPVIMVTARTDSHDVVAGLEAGADDYVTKPLVSKELAARIRALLRRVQRARELAATRQPVRTLGSLRIDVSSRRVESAGAEVHLTPLEFDLLLALADRPGVVRGRDDLLREVWGWAEPGRTRTLDSHVKALRSKIGPERVRTVHGVGYALEV